MITWQHEPEELIGRVVWIVSYPFRPHYWVRQVKIVGVHPTAGLIPYFYTRNIENAKGNFSRKGMPEYGPTRLPNSIYLTATEARAYVKERRRKDKEFNRRRRNMLANVQTVTVE